MDNPKVDMSRFFVTFRYVLLLYFCTLTSTLTAQVFEELVDSIKRELNLGDDANLPTKSTLDDGEQSLYKEFKFLVDPLRKKSVQDSLLMVQKLSSQLSPRVEMFGWHPHWIKNGYKHYNYNMLSTLAFFSYDINIEERPIKGFFSLRDNKHPDSIYTIKNLRIFKKDSISPTEAGGIDSISFTFFEDDNRKITLKGSIRDSASIGDSNRINYVIGENMLIQPLDVVVGGGFPNDSNAIFQWRTSALKDSVGAKGVNLLLTITNFGRENNATFLDNRRMQEVCIDSVLSLLKLNGAQGVDIDFEAIPKGSRVKFTEFVELLAEKLRADNPEYLIYLDLPAIDHSNVFDIKKLQQFVNTFVIMGYDYHGPSTNPGPIAPFYTDSYFNRSFRRKLAYPLNINKSVEAYLKAGLSPNQLILALPHYGGVWEIELTSLQDSLKSQIQQILRNPKNIDRRYQILTNPDSVPTDLFEFKRHLTYNQIRSVISPRDSSTLWSNRTFLNTASNDYANSVNFLYIDTVYTDTSKTDYKVYLKNVWYDDSSMVSARYQWAIEKKLKGVGFWTLGYDENIHSTFWNTVAANFSLLSLEDSLEPVSILGFIVQYQRPIIINLLILLLFMALGFLYALFNWKIREILFTKRTFLLVYICAFFVLALLTISIFDLKWGRNISFAIGLLAGFGIALLIITLFERSRKRIPKF